MRLPNPRGPISETLFAYILAGTARDDSTLRIRIEHPPSALEDADLQIALWALYELHYRSFDDVDDAWEWDPVLLAVRARIEAVFLTALRGAIADELPRQTPAFRAAAAGTGGKDLAARIFDLAAGFRGPELSTWVRTTATAEQVRTMLVNRSIYHLKEADPSSWVLPRLDGAAKSALIELQFDEYGDGQLGRLHAELFADTLRETGLDPTYGAYIDTAGAATLAANNAMSLFGLHRRHRGAAMGHLAAFEASSSLPCRRYAAGLRRVGFSDRAAAYFDEHVEADAIHEQLAARAICARLAADHPELEDDIVLGVLSCFVLEARIATDLMAEPALVQPAAR